jgi:hypothetical protein
LVDSGFASTPVWRRSQRCDAGNCVEVAAIGADIAMRDSKDPDGAILHFTKDEWTAFVAGVRAGEFEMN